MSLRILLALCVTALMCCAVHAKEAPQLSLTAEHFKTTASVREDTATGTTIISTEPGFVERTGPLRMVWHDEFLRGVIDHRTGQNALRVAVLVIYSGSPRAYATASYATASGPRTVSITDLHERKENCATGDCTYTDRMEFPVDEATLRQIAATEDAARPTLWHFELTAKAGPRYDGALSTAEIRGFLDRVDEALQGASIAAVAAPSGTPHDLGISGIPVTAAPERPSRAGLLIAAVLPGSAADQAGLITGDIVYECAGRAVQTPVQLQAALAASAGQGSVVVKLFRGLNSMTMTVPN
jgi:hypothetical protein